MATFDFITEDKFRASLESDYQELNKAIETESWKSVHVLAGSIIEAVLIDYLLAIRYNNMTEEAILRMDLGAAITACKSAGVLSDRVATLAEVIRSYRNLIHPGRVVRLNDVVDQEGAKVAQSLVEMVVREITEKRKQTYGYTAEQIVSKIERDISVTAILGHLLRETKEIEIKRLLLNVLPDTYFDIFPTSSDAFDEAMHKCFRLAFKSASDDIKASVAKKFVSILKEAEEYQVNLYEHAFFRAEDLKFYSSDDKELVKEHLLSAMETRLTERLLKVIAGLTTYLTTTDELTRFTDGLARAVMREDLATKVIAYAEQESPNITTDTIITIDGRLMAWINSRNVDKHSAQIQRLQELRAIIGIPF